MLKISKTHLAIVCLIIANVIWGGTSPILKWSLTNIEPFTLAFVRFFLASLIILPFTIHKLHLRKKDILLIIFLAFIGFNIHISAFLFGLDISSAINAPIIGAAGPIFLILGAIAYLKEKPTRRILIGTTVSLIGVLVIVLRPIFESGLEASLIGNGLFIISTLAFVIYTMLLKKVENEYKPLTLTFWLFAISAIIFFPFAMYESIPNGFLSGLDMKGLIGILYGTIGSSVIAYTAYTFALKYTKASEVGIFMYITPIIAIAIAIPLLGEQITIPFLIGALLVFSGIVIAEAHIHSHKYHAKMKHHTP